MSAVLVVNSGSSSLKYAVFDGDRAVTRGQVERVRDPAAAVAKMIDALGALRPDAIGHRLVHGGRDRFDPARIDDALLAELAGVVPFAPLHLPAELAAIAAVRARFADVPQVACFDTAFHRTLPDVARRFALPAELYDAGVRRYGFHGLSYEHVRATLGASPPARAIFAHLGNGASMVAVRDGRALETTMAFTPTAGLVMGTRSGDLDPGVLVYLLEHRGYDAERLDRLVNHEAGLTALSGGTSDMQQLLALRTAGDARAALAIDVFCYRAKLWIGALAAALGGVELLVFTGGIGEHAAPIRAQICDGLDFLRIADTRVVPADEERVIARHVQQLVRSVS